MSGNSRLDSNGHIKLLKRLALKKQKDANDIMIRFHCMALALGHMVLVRAKALGWDHKIADKWEQNPYMVIGQMDNQPVFKVQPRDAKDQEGIKILHQDTH